MGQGESGFSGCRLGLPQLSPTGAGFLPRLPTLPLACFLAPYPPSPLPPFPRRGRGILSFLMQGASPLASPGAETGRHLQPLPCRASGGGWFSSPPANPAFSLLSCPLSPFPPSPGGEGGFLVFLCKGLRPLHPRELNPAALTALSMHGIRRGAGFLLRLPTLPLACFLAPCPPSPLPPGGEGGDSWFSYARGSAPCIPGG